MKNLEDSDLIIKFLANETDKFENAKINDWRKQNNANELFFNDIREIWENPEAQNKSKEELIDDIWKKFHKKLINVEQRSKNKNIEVPIEEFVSWKFYFLRIAVVFVLGIGIWYFLNDDIENDNLLVKVENNGETVKKVVLPDSSLIFLNSKSKIEYNCDFSLSREVFLEGEAFFDIRRGKNVFIVRLSGASIEVYGTSFSICAFEKNDEIDVIVETGNVLFLNNYDNENPQKVYLQCGDKGILKKSNNTIEKCSNEDNNYLSWKTKKLVFEKASINEIAEVLEKTYNSEIIVNQDINDKYLLTARFSEQSLDTVIQILNSEFEKINTDYSNLFSVKEK